jgi:hypothetical protein
MGTSALWISPETLARRRYGYGARLVGRHEHVGTRNPELALLHRSIGSIGMHGRRLSGERDTNGESRGGRHDYFSTVHGRSPLGIIGSAAD